VSAAPTLSLQHVVNVAAWRHIEPDYSISAPTTADGVFAIVMFAENPRKDAVLISRRIPMKKALWASLALLTVHLPVVAHETPLFIPPGPFEKERNAPIHLDFGTSRPPSQNVIPEGGEFGFIADGLSKNVDIDRPFKVTVDGGKKNPSRFLDNPQLEDHIQRTPPPYDPRLDKHRKAMDPDQSEPSVGLEWHP
jgi:hypothetical protein